MNWSSALAEIVVVCPRSIWVADFCRPAFKCRATESSELPDYDECLFIVGIRRASVVRSSDSDFLSDRVCTLILWGALFCQLFRLVECGPSRRIRKKIEYLLLWFRNCRPILLALLVKRSKRRIYLLERVQGILIRATNLEVEYGTKTGRDQDGKPELKTLAR